MDLIRLYRDPDIVIFTVWIAVLCVIPFFYNWLVGVIVLVILLVVYCVTMYEEVKQYDD